MRLFLLILGMTLWILPATAQQMTENEEKARTLFRQAEQHYQSGQYADCLIQLDSVRTLLGRTNARVQYLTVKALVAQKVWTKAQTELDTYFQLPDSNSERATEMKKMAAQIRSQLALAQSPKPTAPPPAIALSGQTRQPARLIGLKLLTAAIGLGAGGYAFALNKQYVSKRDALATASFSADPDRNGIITNRASFNQWQAAYNEAQTSKSRNGLFKTCIGIAAVAALAETYLLVRKPSRRVNRLSFSPTTQTWGVGVHYAL